MPGSGRDTPTQAFSFYLTSSSHWPSIKVFMGDTFPACVSGARLLPPSIERYVRHGLPVNPRSCNVSFFFFLDSPASLSLFLTICNLQSLRLSTEARRDYSVGEVVNLMSVDAQRISDVIYFLHELWVSPLSIAGNRLLSERRDTIFSVFTGVNTLSCGLFQLPYICCGSTWVWHQWLDSLPS